MKKIYSSEITDVFTAVGIVVGFYGLMAAIALMAW